MKGTQKEMLLTTETTGIHALHTDAFVDRRHVEPVPMRSAEGASALALSSVSLLLAAPVGALAQQPPEAAPIEEIQVTGSRIQRTGFTTPVPVTSISSDELRDMNPGNTIAEQLDQLPQFMMTDSAQRGGGSPHASAGQSFLNMRGAGRERTLVLLDGSRVVPSDRWSSVNVDYFPSALIRTVEVVTGGASAAYGADALAGVTNFILDREFTGFQASIQGGINEFGDGESWETELAFGTSLTDRLHVIGSVEAREISPIARADREYNTDEVRYRQDWGLVSNPDWDPADPPGTHPRLLTRPFVHSTQHTPTGLINEPGFSYDRHVFSDDATYTRAFVESDYATVLTGQGNQSGGPEYYNARIAAQQGPSRHQVRQRSGFLGFDYELNDTVNLWGHGILGRVESISPRTRNIGEHTGIWHLTMFRDNPFLPEHINQAMHDEGVESIRVDRNGGWWLPGEEGAFRRAVDRHDVFTMTIGGDWQLPGGWNLRGAYQYGEADKESSPRNAQRIDRTHLAFDAVVDPETGGIVCNVQLYARTNPNWEEELHAWSLENTRVARHDAGKDPSGPSPVDFPVAVDSIDGSIQDCVPLNPLGLGNASLAAYRYVFEDDKVGVSSTKQHFAEVLLTGTLHAGWGAGAIEQAVGVTYRDESIWQGVDAATAPVDALGPPLNAPEFGIRGIPGGFEGGSPNMHRFSTIPTFSGGFDVWEIFSETVVPLYTAPAGSQRVEANFAARFAQYSRAGGNWTWKGGLDLHVTSDLRLRGTYSRDIREGSFSEQFDQQGGGGNVDDPAFDFNNFEITTTDGGNPDILPERADTLALGLVYEPAWLGGLQLSVDWYDIDLSEAIGQLGQQRLVEECFFNNVFCETVDRDADGVLQRVVNPFLNIDDARISGVDMEMVYRAQPNLVSNVSEALTVRALAGYLRENSVTPLDGERFDQAGGVSRPKWTGMATVTYDVGPVGARLQQRYIHSSLLNLNWQEGVDVDSNRVPSASYTNLRLSYTRDTAAGSWTGSLNINNLFDRDPPIMPSFSQRGVGAQTTNNIFDLVGRRYTVGIRYRQ